MIALLIAALLPLQVDRNPTTGVRNAAVTDANIGQTICEVAPNPRPANWQSWSQRQRPDTAYTDALKRRQLPPGADLKLFEEDHVFDISSGGDPHDPHNLRPQAWAGPDGAHAKDVLEDTTHRAICNRTMTIEQAHAIISVWILAHHPYPVVQLGAPQ